MFERTVSPDDLDRLARLRVDAEREYNDALTRLDRALPRPFDAPPPPAAPDDGAPAGLEAAGAARLWQPPAPEAPAWRRGLHRLLAPLVGPAFERQEKLNRALLAHGAQRAAAEAAERRRTGETLARIGTHLAETLTFQSRLVQYLQRITAFVDTRDREVAGLMRRINEDNGAAIAGVTAGLEALASRQVGLRESVQVLHGASRTAARELHRLRDGLAGPDAAGQPAVAPGPAGAPEAADTTEPAAPAPEVADATRPAAPAPEVADATGPAAPAPEAAAGAATYAVFEDTFRGSPAEITGRQRRYLSCFEGTSDVLDVGCGRGEFLALLRDAGIPAHGIDANVEMVERCRERGLDATPADALAYVAGLPEESLGGLFAAQVVEHFEADYLLLLLAALHRALRPGARIVVETINPASWSAFFSAYIRDITHRHPLHPDTLGYLLRAHGFVDVDIVYSAPVPDAGRLQRAAATADDGPGGAALRGVIEVLNGNVDRLNDLLFAHQDYAAVGTRG